jgi:hypothetical protein
MQGNISLVITATIFHASCSQLKMKGSQYLMGYGLYDWGSIPHKFFFQSLAHLALYPMSTATVSCKRSGQAMKLTTLFNPEQRFRMHRVKPLLPNVMKNIKRGDIIICMSP